ncbi:MAG: serine/threonine-protein kinase RsbW [Thermoleophilaceae bacterium]|jgi:anti-sigma regulatory factor (Ser/Thr protein kinase)|nr:serine/threonine-protein kinase RsbW [Thermoleophilaceae bacterium]
MAPQNTPFPRFEQRRQEAAAEGWLPLDLGGHEVVSRLHMRLRPGPQAVGEGRHALDRLEGSISDEQLSELRLLVTELVTNSVRHGAPPDSWITLDVEIYTNAVRVAVTDPGPGFERPETPEPHRDRPGGWGLCLVDRLSDRWGVDGGETTSVWFEVDRSARTFATAA